MIIFDIETEPLPAADLADQIPPYDYAHLDRVEPPYFQARKLHQESHSVIRLSADAPPVDNAGYWQRRQAAKEEIRSALPLVALLLSAVLIGGCHRQLRTTATINERAACECSATWTVEDSK